MDVIDIRYCPREVSVTSNHSFSSSYIPGLQAEYRLANSVMTWGNLIVPPPSSGGIPLGVGNQAAPWGKKRDRVGPFPPDGVHRGSASIDEGGGTRL